MKPHAPPKKARGELVSKTARKMTESLEYHALAFLAKVFERRFWFCEQRHAQLMDRLENERGGK